jgi:hypothetical protein
MLMVVVSNYIETASCIYYTHPTNCAINLAVKKKEFVGVIAGFAPVNF